MPYVLDTISTWLILVIVVLLSSSLLLSGWKLVDWIWFRPKKLEKLLRQQGFTGNSYRILHGDLKERAAMRDQAISKPMNFSNQIAPRVIPSVHHTIQHYGKNSFMWLGPMPRVHIMDPEQLKTVFSLINDYQKPTASLNPLAKLLADGLLNHEGQKWVKHRKIINPAFHLEKLKAGEAIQTDLLSILMESNLNEIKQHGNNKDIGMSIEDVIDECKLFYIAGQETTATLLTWTMVLLSSYSEWQERARAEVFEIFGNKKPDYDGLSRLKVVTMILNEVLRLYPPVSMFGRLVKKETKLGKLTLPAGVMLGIPVVLMQCDPELWGEDAHEFKPERFSEGVSKAAKNSGAFVPFGWGPRICIGLNFAMIEAKMTLSMILQRFSLELSSSYTHAPIAVITTQPQHGAHIILHKLELVT